MGNITVTVQTEKRLAAITSLAIAVKHLSKALAEGTHVLVQNCNISGSDIGLRIDTAESVTETKVVEVEENKK